MLNAKIIRISQKCKILKISTFVEETFNIFLSRKQLGLLTTKIIRTKRNFFLDENRMLDIYRTYQEERNSLANLPL